MRADIESVVGACGVSVIYNFGDNDWGTNLDILHNDPGEDEEFDPDDCVGGGAGWCCAGFNYTEKSNKMWDYLNKRFKLVYRTPDRINVNSGNNFFFAIFDTRSV